MKNGDEQRRESSIDRVIFVLAVIGFVAGAIIAMVPR